MSGRGRVERGGADPAISRARTVRRHQGPRDVWGLGKVALRGGVPAVLAAGGEEGLVGEEGFERRGAAWWRGGRGR